MDIDDIVSEFERGVDDYWKGIIPDEYNGLTAQERNSRFLSPYLLGWLTVGDADNGVGYFRDED